MSAGSNAGQDPLASASVLVVDDEPGMRHFLVKTLEPLCRRVDEAEHARLLVAQGQRPESLAALAGWAPLLAPPKRLQIREHAAYLHGAAGILQSQVATALLSPRGRAITTRNWATVLKLQALVNAGDSGGGA